MSGYLDGVNDVVKKISKDDIEATINVLYEAWEGDKAVYLAGNGGSASTATHFAADLNKYVSDEAPHWFRAFALIDNIPLMSAHTNDDGWSDVYSYQLESFMKEGDVFVGISVHGGSGGDKAGPWIQNLLMAAKVAK